MQQVLDAKWPMRKWQRIKAEDYKVSDANATLARFKTLLGKLVKVPNSEIEDKPKRKAAKKRKA
jgi:hypothetical protein